jgi:hypothetical protein
MAQPKHLELHKAAFLYPAIDNHAHPLLKGAHRNTIPFEAVISEGEGAAMADSIHTLACMRATNELAGVFGLNYPSWNKIKTHRDTLEYDELCRTFLEPCNIQCLLLDDGLGGVAQYAEPWQWHRKFCPVKRIVRVEIEAEVILCS